MLKKFLLTLFLLGSFSHPLLAQPAAREGYEIAWFDEFDAAELNETLWTAVDLNVPTNHSQQDYLPEQISVADGKLVITSAKLESRGLPYRSGQVISKSLQKYGRWDVRAKLPTSKGMWPAIWLLPDARWPSAGEIDIMENRGDEPTKVIAAIHYGTNPPYKHHFLTENHTAVQDGKDVNFHAGWHVYSCEWDPAEIRFYVDDVLHWTVNDADADGFLTHHVGAMRLLINTAVGGSFLENPDESTVWPQQFEIDYVHVYSRSEIAPNVAAVADPAAEIRVMSFNIRFGSANDGDNHWDKRKNLVTDTIRAFDPDIFGVQETLDFQAAYIGEQIAGYQYVGRSREKIAERGEQCGIFFRSDRFDKLGEGHFWLSESPDEPGSQSWDSSLPRMATWVKLWDRRNRKSLFLLNTHFDHIGETARAESAKIIRKFVTELPSNPNVIVTGDFNAGENSAPYQALFSIDPSQTQLTDTFRFHVPAAAQSEGTFNGFTGVDSGQRIDWIGVTEKFEIESAAIDKTSFDHRYPSDHFPVTAVLKFKR